MAHNPSLPTVSVVMITYNEAKNLPRSLASVAWADEIIIVDQGSTDATQEIAQKHGATWVHQDWLGFGAQKNVAIDHATSDWILSLDADEVIPPATAKVIQDTISNAAADAFYLSRITYFLGRWIRYGGWYPDRQLRLFKRGVTHFNNKDIHERVEETPHTKRLAVDIEHYSYKDVSDYIARLNRYTSDEATMRHAHESWNGVKLLFKPWYRFVQQYVFGFGFLDGVAGFLIAGLSAWYVFVVHIKIYERRLSKEHRAHRA